MKRAIVQNVLGVFAAAVVGSSAWAAPVPFGGHYYDVIRDPGITWADARVAALSSFYLGNEGHLVTITSAAEHAAVNGMIVTNGGGGEMWAGGFQNPAGETSPGAGWTWVNGEGPFPGVNSVAPYAVWNGGEPNDAYGAGSEQFLGLNLGPGFNDEGNLDLITGYVIEYDPDTRRDVPEGGSLMLFGVALAALRLVRLRPRRDSSNA